MRLLARAAVSVVVWLAAANATAQTLPTFVTDAAPRLSIGLVEGDQVYLLSGIGDAVRLTDGRLVIANCGSSELRYYDLNGRHLLSVGQRGQGPGEFQSPRRLFVTAGDSVGAYDGFPAYRISIFDPTGKLARDVRVPPRVDVLGRLNDGTFVGRIIGEPPRQPGVQRRPITFYRLNANGESLDSLRGLLGNEVSVGASGPARTLRMARVGVMAMLPDRLVFGDQSEAAYVEFGPDLRQLRKTTTITRPEAVTPEIERQWEATKDVVMAEGGTLPVLATSFASHMPAYRDLVAGTDARLWVQDPFRPGVYPLVWTAYQ
ncbi:MAG: hypothetical protein ACRENP_27675, partial [Longimicrobiales bacterium]